LFEIANGGTLFLDEIGEMKPELQAKLLSAIEGKKIRRLGGTKDVPCDVRIITASSRNIQAMIPAGTFREDLFFRIAVLEITVPPLRERSSDIPALVHQRLNVEQQLAGRNAPYQIAEHALKALALYEWPGNIRELHNIVSRLVTRIDSDAPITHKDILSTLPKPDQLPEQAIASGSLLLPAAARVINPGEDLYAFIARIQLLAIDTTVIAMGNDTKAAHRLGYCRSSLVDLRSKIMKGTFRGARRKSLENPDQPSLPVA
jgi:transcriptional regulator with PAS, ATPase and Fis domain